MIRYLLDTNIVSYFVKGVNAHLVKRMQHAFAAQDIAISAITRAEIRSGLEMMEELDKRRRRIDLLLNELPVLPWNTEAADQFGRINAHLRRNGTPIGDMDTLIAAHALAEKLTLVTHNTRHFEKVPGLKVEDWMG
jgi:predicted nucleic acid-binding protein